MPKLEALLKFKLHYFPEDEVCGWMPGRSSTPFRQLRHKHSRFVEEISHGLIPFTWCADRDKIIAVVKGGH